MLYWTEVVNGDGYWAWPKLWGGILRHVYSVICVIDSKPLYLISVAGKGVGGMC